MYSVVQILSFTPFFKVVPPYKIHAGHLAVVVIVGGKPVAVIISYVISAWKQSNENGKVTIYILYYFVLSENVFT